jgi:hypothetical protein
MGAMLIVISSKSSDDAFQLILVENEEVIKTFLFHCPDQSFTVGICLRSLKRGFQFLTQSVTLGEFRPFHLPFEHNELLAKNSVFCNQFFTAACDVRGGTSDKNGRFWFAE